MRIYIAGGGSGGHIFPGIAVAEEIMKRDDKAEVIFMGTESGIEARVVPREGYQIRFLKAEGVLGRNPLRKLAAVWKLIGSVMASRGMFIESPPDLVIGTGGYVSAAPVAAARLMGIPSLVMEQNLMPGLANRVLGKIADQAAVTYYESVAYFPRDRARITGNPIRHGLLKGSADEALRVFSLRKDLLTILVLGGSAGASKINNVMSGALNHLLDLKDKVQFLHQSGERDYENVRKSYRTMGFTAMVSPFIYQMAEAYALADLLVSRAGATTLAEITAMGKASILVPYPHAAGHQELNARKLFEMGGCRMISDGELTADVLASNIRELACSEGQRNDMKRQSRAFGRPDAAQKVVDMAFSLVRMHRGDV